METAKIAVDSCYVLRQFLTPLPSIDFREIRGLLSTMAVGLLFHILSQLQGSVLYGDCTDLQRRSKASDVGGGGAAEDFT